MVQDVNLRVPPFAASDIKLLEKEASKTLRIDAGRIKSARITRRSIDARQRKVMVNITLRVYVDEVPDDMRLVKPVDYPVLDSDAPEAVVVGAGPAGLFAALRLIELGIRPVVLERGKDVDSRRKDMADIARSNRVDPGRGRWRRIFRRKIVYAQ